ncbi:uncharacterized protein EURHEDRAFT_299314 [Aspergillus ruber CBS 135680]|uniref:Uncharacterized protein n=1 Tax=Aspergillus ruber (strain CBS 135680) TaxID=1388766 RepID=A0A017SLE5_ASPRC|nr:uncharacterized protein EURHEDRAFT_299314 [Aspergillus ruber CBS 135680]EYE97566.1 hypothetical protein EURHEDRAFT_299314 [Aspergillus ruber CBS 135680]
MTIDKTNPITKMNRKSRQMVSGSHSPRPLLHIRRSQCLDNTRSFTEPRPEDPVRVLEHAILQGNDDELRSLETGLDQTTDVLCVRQIKRSIDFIQNVHRCGFELQQSHDQREGDQGPSDSLAVHSSERRDGGNIPLTTTQLSQTLLPHLTQTDFNFQTIGDILALRRIQLRKTAGQKLREDLTKVGIDLNPGLVKSLLLVFIQVNDCLFDLALVADHGLHHVLQSSFLLLNAVNHVHDLRVDLLLHPLETFGNVAQRRLAFRNVLVLEVINSIGASEIVLFVSNPLML